ncbi:MAG: LPP20 family lipoprotein [Treponema sp.]|nr:LPP20 family lipoprotein [Treponema sp.]
MIKRIVPLCAILIVLFSGFVFAQTPNEANAAARDALRRLESALSGESVSGLSTPPPAQVTRGGNQPRWTDDPYAAYPRERFIAVTGTGVNRNDAERRALVALAAYFGQSIQADFSTTTAYTQAVNSGTVNVSENSNVRDRIITAASMDNLIGAEIGNIWDDGRGTVYAVAFLDRAKTISIYTDMIILNNQNITLLTAMSNAEKNTFNGLARFRLASNIAGINTNYASVVSMAGGSTASLNLRNAEFYNLEVQNIIQNITVVVNVSNDRSNRVQDAFARVLSSLRLRTRGNNPPYTLEVRLNVSELRTPASEFVFCNIELSANLIENSTGASLIAFNESVREGHTIYTGAEARAFSAIEGIIAEKFSFLLQGYINSLIPR